MADSGGRARQIRLAGIVLSRVNYGEADLIVTFLTRERGLVNALARYGRRSIRRFGGGLLSPGASAWYDFTFKPGSTLAFVENGEENPKAPRLAPEALVQSLGAFALELVKGFEAPDNPAEESFNLLMRHLVRLARQIPPPEGIPGGRAAYTRSVRLISLDFYLKYLELAGFGPRLSGCLLCGTAPEAGPGWKWNPAAGGLYCPACAPPDRQGRAISQPLLERLSAVPQAGQQALDDHDLAEAELFFEKLAEHHLGRRLKAMKTARQILRGKR
ncbi:recombination protein O N-terminal domain-containing protein [Deltaproteobacteria bacterium OttesenSCG-928-K17]|nr:recombination protein O N-terminal domain-containing protein [Deltaproteobacteria bacterium OttesenSCG-928-K17]